MSNGNGSLNPTESRIFELLKDGKGHTAVEIHGCLRDEMQDLKNISFHITCMRKKLAKQNLAIVTDRTSGAVTTYRLARFL